MMDYSSRSALQELMEDPSVPPHEMARTLDELEAINRLLGGYRPSLAGVSRLLPKGQRSFTLLDVGVGCGDFARRLVRWASRRGIVARVHGIDIIPAAVEHARARSRAVPGIDLEVGDALTMTGEGAYDIVHAALVLHHCDDSSLPHLLRRMYELSRLGIVVNDLHRHAMAYHSIRILTRLFSRSRLIRHDGPVSVLRAFRRGELEAFARAASLPRPEIRWRHGFRWQVVIPR